MNDIKRNAKARQRRMSETHANSRHLDYWSKAVCRARGRSADYVLLRQQAVVAAHHHVQHTLL